MGAIGGIARAVSGPGKYSTVSNVKNQQLAGAINAGISDLGTYRGDINSALGQFTSGWNAATPQTQTATNQEVGAIGQFYNGAMSNQLAQLRQQRQTATNAAADVAVQQALRAQNQSRLTGSGGLSSYNTRQGMAATTPIRVQAALDNANQARADLGYVTGNQIGLAGARQGLINQQAQRALVPAQQEGALRGQYNQLLGGLVNADQANTFYGLQKSPNQFADIADSLDQGILNAASIYSSIGTPGMGGHARGGLIRGPGTWTSDSIPARLSTGEFVVPADVVHIPGVLPLLEKLRHLHRMHHVGKHQDALKARMKAAKVAKADGGMVRGYSGGGYADGGLAGSAQGLQARVDADLATNWAGPAMVPVADQGGGGGGWGGQRRSGGYGAPPMPGDVSSPSAYFHPSNFNDISPEWRDYALQTANKYNNPNSPHYIPPGTYE